MRLSRSEAARGFFKPRIAFDLPTTLGITVFATTAIIVINLFIDVIYAVIDPRIRLT